MSKPPKITPPHLTFKAGQLQSARKEACCADGCIKSSSRRDNDSGECSICMDEPRAVRLWPCGHSSTGL